MRLDDGTTAVGAAEAAGSSLPTPTTTTPPAAVDGGATATSEGEAALSKKQMKKLAKGKGKEKKDKPTWNQPGEGKKKTKKNDDKKSPALLPTPAGDESFVNPTPRGCKKDLSALPMADAYHPRAVESAWQDWWEASGYYSCDPASAVGRTSDEKFVMVIPPPNVTGSLHLGHALTAAVEDTLTRWHRMMGHATLYVPGESHLFVLLRCVGQLCASGISAKTSSLVGRLCLTH